MEEGACQRDRREGSSSSILLFRVRLQVVAQQIPRANYSMQILREYSQRDNVEIVRYCNSFEVQWIYNTQTDNPRGCTSLDLDKHHGIIFLLQRVGRSIDSTFV